MNQGPLLFLGIFVTLASSFWGLVLVPEMRIGHQLQVTNMTTGVLYPANRGGLAKQGAEVYRSLGCVECHSQEVRGVGSDLARGWGTRMTVAQDYLGDYPIFLGQQRIGPDLANIGMRQPNEAVLLRKLYNPRALVPGSMMPPFQFLFEKRKLRPGQTVPDSTAVHFEGGYETVPGPQAEALIAYLQSLRIDTPLYEAPMPNAAKIAATNATSTAKTNLPPATNAATSNNPGGSK
jgi:cytochrome c oxidase cbb3-type subunit 2